MDSLCIDLSRSNSGFGNYESNKSKVFHRFDCSLFFIFIAHYLFVEKTNTISEL